MRRLGVVSFLVVALAALSACGGNSPGGSGGTAPTITTQPTDQTVTAPATATFTVVATGTAPLSYQWQKNNANIPGAPDSASYTTPATMLGDPVATFRVIVSNGVNPSATSNSAALTVSSGPATPALVQHVSSSNTRNNNFTSPFCYHTQLPGLTTAGNAVVVGFTYNSNVTPTVTDDQGDSYTIEPPFYDSTHTQSIAIAAAFNVKAGARAISVCFASNPGGFVEPMATEFDNVIGFDVAAAGNKGTGTTLMAGSMTPTVTGDLAYQVAHSLATNQDQASFTAGSQSNITWKLVTADLMDGWTGQYGIYNSVGAIDPTMSMGTSKNWISTAVLLKTGTTGGVPSGMRIVSLLHENIPTKTAAGGNATSFPNPTKLQFPCSGNLGVVTVGGGNQNLTGITDSNGNTWTQVGTYVTTSDPSTNVFYAANARCSPTQTLTVNWNGNTTDQTILYYDVAGAAASPLDVAGGATGDQGFASNTLTTFSIAPTTSSTELIFCAVPVQFDTVTGLTTGFNDANMFDGESLSGPEPVDENNGWGHFVTNSTSTVSVVWNLQSFSPAVQIWAAVGAAFKAGP